MSHSMRARPRRVLTDKDLLNLLDKELRRRKTFWDGGVQRSATYLEIILGQLVRHAAKGEKRALAALVAFQGRRNVDAPKMKITVEGGLPRKYPMDLQGVLVKGPGI